MVKNPTIEGKRYLHLHSEPLEGDPDAIIRFYRPKIDNEDYFVYCQPHYAPLPYLCRYTHVAELAAHLFACGMRSRDVDLKANKLRLRLKMLERRFLAQQASERKVQLLPENMPVFVLRRELEAAMNLQAIRKHQGVKSAKCTDRVARLRNSVVSQFGVVIDMRKLWPLLNTKERERVRKNRKKLTALTDQTAVFRSVAG